MQFPTPIPETPKEVTRILGSLLCPDAPESDKGVADVLGGAA
jgi:hypothetical protein